MFAQTDTAAESYKPNSPPEPQAIRSQQTSEAGNTVAGAGGVPGALTNQLGLTKDKPIGDLAYGVDNTFASRALDESRSFDSRELVAAQRWSPSLP